MSKRLFPVVFGLMLIALVLVALPVAAQEQLTYDEPVLGNLTAAVGAVEYTFSGAAGDVIFIICQRTSYDDAMDEPKVILTAEDGDEVVNSYGFGSVEAAAQLPADGSYTLTVTSEDGASVGEYTLAVQRVPPLILNKQMTGVMTSEEINFFFVKGGQPFVLNYRKSSGDFHPSLSVNLINDGSDEWSDAGSLATVAILEGDQIEGGMLIITGESDLYIVTLTEALFDFNWDPLTAEYLIGIEPLEE